MSATKLATVPANTATGDPPMTHGGLRLTTGTISVRVESDRSYCPPAGWRIVSVHAKDGLTFVRVEREAEA